MALLAGAHRDGLSEGLALRAIGLAYEDPKRGAFLVDFQGARQGEDQDVRGTRTQQLHVR
jgi:hypothetical protein